MGSPAKSRSPLTLGLRVLYSKMASKRVATSAIDWAKASKVCPKFQIDILRAIKAKHESFVNRVHQLPEELPKIDFVGYKARLPDPGMAERFKLAYEALSIPYPVDKANILEGIKKENDQKDKEIADFVAECQAKIAEADEFLKAMDTLPKYNEMTKEMYFYYFPELYPDPMKPGRMSPWTDEEQMNSRTDFIAWDEYDKYRRTEGWLHKGPSK